MTVIPLIDLCQPAGGAEPPGDVRAFLREAGRRIERFQSDRDVPAFVPSDYLGAYAALHSLAEGRIGRNGTPEIGRNGTPEPVRGGLFCEWGSGFGVVACLAAMLDFDATGIEIAGELVDAARQLADDFGLPVEFVHGSFIPPADEACLDPAGYAWLATSPGDPGEGAGLGPEDFDVVYAYPWPDEERLVGDLFKRHARAGAVLVTYHGGARPRLRRKSRPRAKRRVR